LSIKVRMFKLLYWIITLTTTVCMMALVYFTFITSLLYLVCYVNTINEMIGMNLGRPGAAILFGGSVGISLAISWGLYQMLFEGLGHVVSLMDTMMVKLGVVTCDSRRD